MFNELNNWSIFIYCMYRLNCPLDLVFTKTFLILFFLLIWISNLLDMFSARNEIGFHQRLEAYRRIVDHKNNVSKSEDSDQSDSSSDQSVTDSD